MKIPASVKPAVWGAIAGAVAAIIVGFSWGGWVTGGAARQQVAAGAEAAIVLAFVPLCIAKAEQEPEQRKLLKAEGSWDRDEFVEKAGWVANVGKQYRSAVAGACANAIVEAME